MGWNVWEATASPILVSIRRVYPVAKANGSKITKVVDDLAKPDTRIDMLAFDGMVLEMNKDHVNIWQFRILDNNQVEGRPTGGSRGEHKLIVDPVTGQTRRRKQGEWFKTPWVPQGAITAVVQEGL